MLEYVLRNEHPDDYHEVDNLTRETFWNLHQPGCDEHLLAHKLRLSEAFVPELDFVAVTPQGKILGNILYSRSKVVAADGTEHTTLTFGPLSVLPEFQKQGVGGALVRHSLGEAARLGYKGVIIFGHPSYYPRFGFQNAARFGITTGDGKNFDAFMALELAPSSLSGISGRFAHAPAFDDLPQAEVDAFDKGFPPKEKGEPREKF